MTASSAMRSDSNTRKTTSSEETSVSTPSSSTLGDKLGVADITQRPNYTQVSRDS